MGNPETKKENMIKMEQDGVVIKARFNDRDLLEEAIIVDEKRDLKIKIVRNMDEVTFETKWRGFQVKMKKGFGINLPGIVYRDMFEKNYRTPLEYYKVILNIMAKLIDDEYWIAQKIYEKEEAKTNE
jgi:hypothetical protein